MQVPIGATAVHQQCLCLEEALCHWRHAVALDEPAVAGVGVQGLWQPGAERALDAAAVPAAMPTADVVRLRHAA